MLNKLLDRVFKKRVLFMTLSSNYVFITDMESGLTIERKSFDSFSDDRLIIADFKLAAEFIRKLIEDLLDETKSGRGPFKVVLQIQDDEKTTPSPVERKIYQDVIEHAGAAAFFLIEHQNEVSVSEVLNLTK